ncbi:4-hydroxy-4-methyl-2-oxoglutarate aldolase/4-carboxy-4-hydroxy-2-oxoadipate aldolase [Pseudocercospora fuligena]|uniref:4-hydroxy-4-methyl-2-oxoglutarate aldolase/4-carboxy-4-hydroxy-2-oxoadipate aldolase n=1 Tax=Pseudocercospora fuligena TaxID=685502 RepID=A0A8H6R8S7_9PEZI|nr:4-hydroxy-4-methyl-2-oxoglutarate aldolase/4-carboxy-4-hydroxy-2-oxoadipate aldolase [Pseudocercospora fuligena]
MSSRRGSFVDVAAICDEIKVNYSPCDVADALLVINVAGAGHLANIHPIPTRSHGKNRIVAPISTIIFVSKDHKPSPASPHDEIPGGILQESNLPKDKHWTDVPPSGSVVLMQQPEDQVVAVLGDIVASRYKMRGVLGCFVDGRVRDISSQAEMCDDGRWQAWTKGLSSVGTSMQAKPWAVDVPIQVGLVNIRPGDIMVADEAEQVCTVIPQDKLTEVAAWLPRLKKADDGVLKDAQSGVDLKTSFTSHPDHYTQQH